MTIAPRFARAAAKAAVLLGLTSALTLCAYGSYLT
jgi:hypothetical protein